MLSPAFCAHEELKGHTRKLWRTASALNELAREVSVELSDMFRVVTSEIQHEMLAHAGRVWKRGVAHGEYKRSAHIKQLEANVAELQFKVQILEASAFCE